MTNLNLNINQNDVELIPENHPETQEPVVGAEILIEQLYKFYGEVKVLEDLNLHIQPGEFLAIVGRSGCGKSTLLRCINGLEPIQGGEIRLTGSGVLGKDVDWTNARQKIGKVFQNYELFGHMNVIDNILLGPLKVQKRHRDEAEQV
ncbi:ATP-binding cassette domain-containing protein, partial [Enterobacter hormaechei]|uniref:ATP-binding cassette domain-containing protein n=1 Tax=Enterobacter hormaechei TaxID=158836 RepID=UPI001C4040D0